MADEQQCFIENAGERLATSGPEPDAHLVTDSAVDTNKKCRR